MGAQTLSIHIILVGGRAQILNPQYFGGLSDISEPLYNFGVAQILLSPQIFFRGAQTSLSPPPLLPIFVYTGHISGHFIEKKKFQLALRARMIKFDNS